MDSISRVTIKTDPFAVEGLAEFVDEFSLSITQALRIQLTAALDRLEPAYLTLDNINEVSNRGGIYQLLLDDESVYIGKSKDSLCNRVGKHYRKLHGRTPGLLERMTFRCLYVNEDLDSLAPEKMLIQTFKVIGKARWNQNGFGNNDPGKKRDGSLVKADHFDRIFSINLDLEVQPESRRPLPTLYQLMGAIRRSLPYTFRFIDPKSPESRVLKSIDVLDDRPEQLAMPVRDWMDWIARKLPDGWMITCLPGYIICYPEVDPGKYDSRMEVWLPDGHGSFEHQVHTPEFDVVNPVDDEDNAVADED